MQRAQFITMQHAMHNAKCIIEQIVNISYLVKIKHDFIAIVIDWFGFSFGFETVL